MSGRSKHRLTITLDREILSLVDRFIDGKRIRNRSHAIEYLLAQQLRPRVRRAVILASDEGVRMRPFTYELPKAMLPVKGRPILEHTITLLRDANIRDITLVVSHLAEQIRTHFGNGRKYGVNVRYIEEKRPSGTAAPLRKAEDSLRGEPFIVMYGDVLVDIDLTDFMMFHETTNALLSLALKPMVDPGEYGVVKLRGNRVIEFIEKPQRSREASALINAGVMILDPSVLSSIPATRGAMLERDVLERLVPTGRVYGYPFEGAWFDVGTPRVYQDAVQHWSGT